MTHQGNNIKDTTYMLTLMDGKPLWIEKMKYLNTFNEVGRLKTI